MNLPFKTLPDLLQYFNHEDKARDFLEKIRWPDGRIICPFAIKEGHIVIVIVRLINAHQNLQWSKGNALGVNKFRS